MRYSDNLHANDWGKCKLKIDMVHMAQGERTQRFIRVHFYAIILGAFIMMPQFLPTFFCHLPADTVY